VCAARDACQAIPNSQGPRAKRSVGIYFTVIGRASARIRLSLRINISLTIGEIYTRARVCVYTHIQYMSKHIYNTYTIHIQYMFQITLFTELFTYTYIISERDVYFG